MQDKTNCCVIEIDKYNDLIFNNVNLNNRVKELQKKLVLKNDIFDSLENYFFEKMILNEDYHLAKIKNYDVNDYHYLELYNSFIKIGITDANYIENSIKIIVEKYKNKGVE